MPSGALARPRRGPLVAALLVRRSSCTLTPSWRSAIATLAKLATVPIADLDLDKSFAADPLAKPYFPRQVKSLMKVSDAQAQAPVKTNPGGILGDIEHAQDLREYFEKGAQVVAQAEQVHGASIVHGDYKIDNVVSTRGCGRRSQRAVVG